MRDLGTQTNLIIQLIKLDSNLPECPVDKIYKMLCSLHQGALKHVGSSKLWVTVSEQYCYIIQSFIKEFVKNCTTCATRRNFPNPVAAKPIISNAFLNRVQVDLISMTSIPDSDYHYICHIWDHYTQYSWARALTSKRAIEVAIFLLHFRLFWCPIILQTDNGREFTAEVIRELLTIWPDVHIINGHPRHSQSQGLVERTNDILQQKVSKWMKDTQRRD
ncbi:3347_t:CDS:2 [Gigaspora rosea]|nr:3347_t:CDS:2 [Gigaspora rosea]